MVPSLLERPGARRDETGSVATMQSVARGGLRNRIRSNQFQRGGSEYSSFVPPPEPPRNARMKLARWPGPLRSITDEEIIASKEPETMPSATSSSRKLLVVGQPVLDHIAHVEIVHQRGTLLTVMDIDAGWIIFRPGSYISTECGAGKRLVFGPFLDYEDDVKQVGKEKAIGRRFRAGEKIPVPEEKVHVVDWRGDIDRFGTEYVGRLGYVNRSPGGGATNCCYIISQVFPKLPIAFTGIYSEESDGIIEDCLETIVGSADIQRVHKPMPINIVLEGISNNRVILKSPQPTELRPQHPLDSSGFMLVNTIYNVYLASACLAAAMESSAGVVACTESLLNESRISSEEARAHVRDLGASGDVDSIFGFFRNVVLPSASGLTYVFNESEFHHLIKWRSKADERIYVKNGDGRILFDQLVLGLSRFRELHAPHKLNVIVTVGSFGAFWLDQDDDLHYCAVLTSDETGKVEGQKNAIGDLFTGVLTALMFGYEGNHRVQIYDRYNAVIKESVVPPMLIAASAAADAGVFDGFYKVREKSVNSNIHLKTNHYRFLGKLNEIVLPKQLESLEEMLRSRLPDITRGQIKGATVLDQIVPGGLLR
jgi:hypothetical protein